MRQVRFDEEQKMNTWVLIMLFVTFERGNPQWRDMPTSGVTQEFTSEANCKAAKKAIYQKLMVSPMYIECHEK